MPTTITHALVGLGLAEVFAPRPRPVSFYGLATVLAVAPDVDVLAFRFGIPYGAFLGHRGFVAGCLGPLNATPRAKAPRDTSWATGLRPSGANSDYTCSGGRIFSTVPSASRF